jgi:hypothetical protein
MLLIDGKPLHLSVDETAPYAAQAEYRLATQGDHWKDYYRAGGLDAECAEKMLNCHTLEANSRYQAWSVSGSQPARLRLPLLAFPAWQVTVDGAATATTIDPATGLISVELPAGTHRVAAVWQRMEVERAGLAITVFAVLMLAVLAFRQGLPPPVSSSARSA